MKKNQEIEILEAVAHPIRKGIISSLACRQQAFSSLMLDCGLDPGSETGIFLYHLSKLMEKGFVEKNDGKYGLTKHGEVAFDILRSLPRLVFYPRTEDGGGKMVSEIPKISVKEVVGGNMVVDKWEFKPGEKRFYEESGRIPSDIFGGTFYVKKCLGEVDLPNEPSGASMIRHETYTRYYLGTEKNKIRTPVKDGWYLGMREYDTISIRDDGVYMLWTSVWGPNFDTEKPDDTFYDPPEKMQELPMKIGDEINYERNQGLLHSKVVGQYVVTIGNEGFDCLLRRSHAVWTEDGEKEISRVSERFVTHGLVDILTRAYHAATQKRRWMFESVKDWEQNPIVECCGEKHYLTSESFLAERTY